MLIELLRERIDRMEERLLHVEREMRALRAGLGQATPTADVVEDATGRDQGSHRHATKRRVGSPARSTNDIGNADDAGSALPHRIGGVHPSGDCTGDGSVGGRVHCHPRTAAGM